MRHELVYPPPLCSRGSLYASQRLLKCFALAVIGHVSLWKAVKGFLKQFAVNAPSLSRLSSPACLDGARVASSTGIDILLLDDFNLVINDTTYLVRPPRRGEKWQQKKKKNIRPFLNQIKISASIFL